MIHLNGYPINITKFFDNTSQVWKLDEHILNLTEDYKNNGITVSWEFQDEGEFLQLAQLKHLLDDLFPNNHIRLLLPYLPYGRQDKIISNDKTFALNSFALLLNNLSFDHVAIMDPHSSIALELIKNSAALYPEFEVFKIFKETNSKLVCYPDAGATLKYSRLYNLPFLHGKKSRDQLTGNINSYSVVGKEIVKDSTVLIVDDICDGGATFTLLANELYKNGAKDVNLFITHGIFSKGLRPLKDANIKRIFTKKGEASEVQGNIVYENTTIL